MSDLFRIYCAKYVFLPGSPTSANEHVPATIEQAKRPGRAESLIPLGIEAYALRQGRARTEFRHGSCNTA